MRSSKTTKVSGIYIITNLVNDKVYIGRSIDVNLRLKGHLNHLKNNKHHNTHLQRAFNKHGVENFTFELLEEYEPEFLCSMENWWCNMLNSHDREHGYNIELTSPYGFIKMAEESKKRLSNSKKGSENKSSWVSILQYDLNGNFIREWESITKASKELNVLHQGIMSCLKISGMLPWYFLPSLFGPMIFLSRVRQVRF